MYSWAQTFFLDPSAVKNASEVGITRVDLYFRGKPKATGNKSGILQPGVEVSIVRCYYGIPIIEDTVGNDSIQREVARREYGEIIATPDASAPTTFRFSSPVYVKTGGEYAFLVKFDGNEDFVLWYSKQGDKLLGTNTPSPGPSGKYIGNLYSYIGSPDSTVDALANGVGYSNSAVVPETANNSAIASTANNSLFGLTQPGLSYLLQNWKAKADTDLKFKVYVARFSHNGVPVTSNASITANPTTSYVTANNFTPNVISNNVIRLTAPTVPSEYIVFDARYSKATGLLHGDQVYQPAPYWPGGTPTPLTVNAVIGSTVLTANASYVLANGATFNAANGFNIMYSGSTIETNEKIVVVSGDTVNVRKVLDVISNTQLALDEPLTFTNATAYFFRAPVGIVEDLTDIYATGLQYQFLHLTDTNANLEVRFVNNVINSVSITANGTGYANSDYLIISGYENVAGKITGGYSARANVRTNASGNLVSVYMSNNGAGFVNTAWLTGANIVINNANGIPTSGSGATFSFNVNTVMKTEWGGANIYFTQCQIINIEANLMKPEIELNNPLGAAHTITHRTLFHHVQDSASQSNTVYYVDNSPAETDFGVKNFQSHYFATANCPTLTSRSNEWVIKYANGLSTNSEIVGYGPFSNSSVYLIDIASNNDFTSLHFGADKLVTHYSRYIINNDYTNEHTNYGNAWAKHVTTKVNFNSTQYNDRLAEDLVVYLTAHRPANTEFKVYGRVHNSKDFEAFDDKDWTLLEQVDGINVYSSADDPEDYIELTYNFPAYPNTDLLLTGTGNVENTTTTTIIGSSTLFTSQLQANDLIKIYQPLFPNNYAVAVVDSVTNSTSLEIVDPIANNGLVGDGLIMERIRTYKHQAFNNYLNENIVRYYNSEDVPFDGYDTFQIKVVFLSAYDHTVPKIDDIRSIAVSV